MRVVSSNLDRTETHPTSDGAEVEAESQARKAEQWARVRQQSVRGPRPALSSERQRQCVAKWRKTERRALRWLRTHRREIQERPVCQGRGPRGQVRRPAARKTASRSHASAGDSPPGESEPDPPGSGGCEAPQAQEAPRHIGTVLSDWLLQFEAVQVGAGTWAPTMAASSRKCGREADTGQEGGVA